MTKDKLWGWTYCDGCPLRGMDEVYTLEKQGGGDDLHFCMNCHERMKREKVIEPTTEEWESTKALEHGNLAIKIAKELEKQLPDHYWKNFRKDMMDVLLNDN